MYYLSVGAIFKNEATILKEWIEHYLIHGVEHFYLINDSSTDDFRQVLRPYEDKITLFHMPPFEPHYLGRQQDAYAKFFLPILKETQWLAVLDLDEYLYSPKIPWLPNALKNYENEPILVVNWVWFGSNGHFEQPASIIYGFTARAKIGKSMRMDTPDGRQWCDTLGNKPIINSKFQLREWTVHWSGTNVSWVKSEHDPIFLINHYPVMSLEYYINYKMKRPRCVNGYHKGTKDRQYFIDSDINDIKDSRLAEQNYQLISADRG